MTASTDAGSAVATVRQVAGKYLTFALGEESYGIQVLKVREIIRFGEITAVPQMPAYIKGVINLRGKIVPVIDLRTRLGLPPADHTERTCIVVAEVKPAEAAKTLMGLIVDDVEEVANVAGADIEEAPDFGAVAQSDHLLGLAKVKGAVKLLLDIDCVVNGGARPSELQAA